MANSDTTAPAGAPSSTVTLATSREEFEHLIGELGAAACIMGTVREALLNSGGYEGGAVQRALELVEFVQSELDAAMRAQEAQS